MALLNQECTIDTILLRNEQAVFVMAGEKPLCLFITRAGEVFTNFDNKPPFYVNKSSFNVKREEAIEYVNNVAKIQSGGGDNRELLEKGFEIDIDDFFRKKED